MSNNIAAPGSSTYASNTLHVGDGTWDSGRDTFLLPNLMGLNFATMQYNGMRNRFKDLLEYHQLIAAHGILAAITFLFVVPFAILIAKFYHRNPRLALRMHIWMQILTVFLATVILVLGWFAVGPERSLTNPHHGIGVAIYVMIVFQVLFGSMVHHIEKKKIRYKIPIKLMLHQWLGRTIALLGIIQIPLGLTLYGSPKSLFVLFAVWGFILLVTYFILSYKYQNVSVDDRSSYYSGTRTDTTGSPEHHHGKLGKIAVGLGGAGLLAALAKRRNSGRSERRTETEGSSHHDSESYVDEKYSEHSRKDHTWRDRLLAAGAAGGLFAAAKSIMGRRKTDHEGSEISDYPHHPLGGAHSITETDMSRVEEGRVPHTPNRPSAGLAAIPAAAAMTPTRPHRANRPVSGGSIHSSYDSHSYLDSPGRSKRDTHTLRDGIVALGVGGYLRHKWNERKDKRDERRVEEMRRRDREDERLARMNSGRRKYTGDGASRPNRRHSSISESEMTPLGGSNPELSLDRPTGAHHPGSRMDITAANTAANAAGLPPPPPFPPNAGRRMSSSASEGYTSPGGGRRHHGHAADAAAAAGLAGAGLGAAAAGRHRRRSSSRRDSSDGTNSPQAAVQVKMHNDGRHVTLRRLDPNERAAERARRQNRPGRSGSISSVGASGDDRWRRVERQEAQQAAQMRAEAIAAGEAQHNIPPTPPINMSGPPPPPPTFSAPPPMAGPSYTSPRPPPHLMSSVSDLPLPPPIPAAGSGMGQGGSPGSIYGSGPSNVDSRAESNRRRRRAERARMEAAARERSGSLQGSG